MNKRAVEIAGFLAQNGWGSTQATPIAADLSTRRYARLEDSENRHAILMDADSDQNTIQFVGLAKVLRDCGISAPEILAADPLHGLVLMEDFGDHNFGRMIDAGANAAPLYRGAVDVLVQLHKSFDKSLIKHITLPVFNSELFTEQAALFLETFFATPEQGSSFRAAWKQTFRQIDSLPQTLILRDFMPDNLMDLADRKGLAATGVLDFQDGGYGPIVYDLASLCENVRRDSGDKMFDEMITYYHQQIKSSISLAELRIACRILSAQRHMRILGIVTRWSAQTGRNDKLGWIPRIREYLAHLLQDEALQPIREWMDHTCPLQ